MTFMDFSSVNCINFKTCGIILNGRQLSDVSSLEIHVRVQTFFVNFSCNLLGDFLVGE